MLRVTLKGIVAWWKRSNHD